MRVVKDSGETKKHEYEFGDKGYFPTLMSLEILLGESIVSNTVGYDFMKNEYTAYFNRIDDLPRSVKPISDKCKDCILLGVKYNNTTKKTRVKKYYKGNYLGIDTHDIIFHTGIYEDTGEYTLYVFEDQTPEDVELGFSKQAYATYYGRTFTKDGEFVRESKYINE